MVRRSVEIHLLRHVAERKLENRDTCVYIHAAIGRIRRNWFVRDYPLKKKRERERGRKKCRRLEIDLRSGRRSVRARARSPRLRGACRPTRFARERIMENAFSMYRRHEEEHAVPASPMFNADARSAPRSLARRGLKHPFPRMKVGKSVIHWRVGGGVGNERPLSRAKNCAENFGFHNSFRRSIDGVEHRPAASGRTAAKLSLASCLKPPLNVTRANATIYHFVYPGKFAAPCHASLSIHLNNFTIKTRIKLAARARRINILCFTN